MACPGKFSFLFYSQKQLEGAGITVEAIVDVAGVNNSGLQGKSNNKHGEGRPGKSQGRH